MPSPRDHTEHAGRSKRLLDMLDKEQVLPEWVIICGLLKAIHYIEALFACMPGRDTADRHSSDHRERDTLLKQERRLEHIYDHYRPIFKLSLLARYLAGGIPDGHDPKLDSEFGFFRQKVFDHHLAQIKQSATKLGGSDYEALLAEE